MSSSTPVYIVGSEAVEVVSSFINALNEQDWNAARKFVSNDMIFEGIQGSKENAEAYFHDVERMRLKYNIQKIFEDGKDVCLIYEFSMWGETLPGCGLYHIENGKINSLRVIFDPRPLLEAEHV